jgi:predicted metalloprotease with PDZ domain
MKLTKYIIPLFCIALGAQVVHAADPPAAAPRAQPQADADARKELDQMRQQMRDLSKRMAEISAQLGDVGPRTYAYRYIGDPDRGMIGVVLARDDKGLRISAVTPGGAADKAGIKAGDVIAAVDGVKANEAGRDKIRNLKIGQQLKVELLRDGKPLQVTVTAERHEPFNFAFSGDMGEIMLPGDGNLLPPDFDKHIQIQVERATQAAQDAMKHVMSQERIAEISKHAAERAQHAIDRMSLSMPWWGLNLASLNPDLGTYFGTDHGVLVLSADADASKTLKSGDVIVAIGGTKVVRPEDALRLLREQPTGSDVKVEVLRQRKTQVLSMKAPEFKSMFVPAPPPPPAPPAPAAPPAPPAPPAPTAPGVHPTPAPPPPPAPNRDIA